MGSKLNCECAIYGHEFELVKDKSPHKWLSIYRMSARISH